MMQALLQERVVFHTQRRLGQSVEHYKNEKSKKEKEISKLHPAESRPVMTNGSGHYDHDHIEVMTDEDDRSDEHQEEEIAFGITAHEHYHRKREINEEHRPH